MIIRTSVLRKMNIHTAKKWPEKVIQRSFIKGHSFPYRLYYYNCIILRLAKLLGNLFVGTLELHVRPNAANVI